MGWESLVISAGIEIADKYKKNLMTRLKFLVKRKRHMTLFGSSGSGKTQFVEALKNIYNNNISKTFYTQKSKLYLDEFPIIIFDTPGHEAAEQLRTEEKAKIIKDGFEGIINIVSYGYSEREINLSEVFDGEQFKEEFLESNRKKEIEHLQRLKSTIEFSDIDWMITLVTKADIWWDRKLEVEKYYENGIYNKEINEIKKNFKHIIIPYCSIIAPYFGIRNSGIFGEKHKKGLQENFLKTLFNLLGKTN